MIGAMGVLYAAYLSPEQFAQVQAVARVTA